MSNIKKYILTSVILGSIAAISAGLIAATNLITKNKIDQNKIDKFNIGVKKIFENSEKVEEKDTFSKPEYSYVIKSYDVKDKDDALIGYVFETEGANNYGKISLLVGLDAVNCNFVSLYLTKNEQSYAVALEDNYVNKVVAGKKDYEDVKPNEIGATRGAELVRDMINEAKKAGQSYVKK